MTSTDTDCTSVGFTGEGRCIEQAVCSRTTEEGQRRVCFQHFTAAAWRSAVDAPRHPVAEDTGYYDTLHDSIPSDVPATVWESDAASKGAGA